MMLTGGSDFNTGLSHMDLSQKLQQNYPQMLKENRVPSDTRQNNVSAS
jgi:hypothetical protein